MTMGRFLVPLALLLAACLTPAHAEQAVRFNGYLAHYNAYTSDLLDPKVASSYGIQRSHNRGVLLVNVQRADAKPSGIRAKVSASAQTINLQQRTVEMREVKEGEVYYYLADFPVNNGETLDFQISVQPEGSKQPYQFTYRQQFFTRER
jgi:hypothetical protein